MALLCVLLAAAFVGAAASDECDSCDADSAFLQLEVSKADSKSNISNYWYPTKSVDFHRSGRSRAQGIFPLPQTIDWELSVPGLKFNHGPLLDDKLNVYLGGNLGKILSLDLHGAKRWEVDGTDNGCQYPVLFAGSLYTACTDGTALALDMMTGERLWESKISAALPNESWTLGVTDDYIFMPAGRHNDQPLPNNVYAGSPAVALLRRADGQLLWKFELGENETTVELTPCMLSDSVIFTGWYGSIYRLSFASGSLIWKAHLDPKWLTMAQVSCTDDGKVIVGFGVNDDDNVGGGVKALDIETGKILWSIALPNGVYTPIGVGEIHGHAGTAIIASMGKPGMPEATTRNHSVWAIDPSTGKTIWTFQTPSLTVRYSRGSSLTDPCWPVAWSPPTISADGTVYINWAYGGVTYALRDSNQDGRCDPGDPEEVSSFDFGIGHQGGPALAPGMLVVCTCHGPRALKASH